jgi:dGTPase
VIGVGDLPPEPLVILGDAGSRRIDTLVHDLVEHSERTGDIVQGRAVGGAMMALRTFMFDRVYLGPTARAEHTKIERVLRGLFEWYCERPDELPEGVAGASTPERVVDYLAGMTDRFAIRAWSVRFVPQGLAAQD